MKVNYETKLEALTRYILAISSLRKDTITPADAIALALVIILPQKHKYNPLSPTSRKTICDLLKISKQNLTNRLYSLQNNSYLYRDEDNLLQISPYFKSLSSKPISLNVSYTYDQIDIPHNITAFAESLYRGRSNPQSSSPPLQESEEPTIEPE